MVNYALVGGGRLARHFSHYFNLLEISHTRWSRDRQSPFNSSAHADAAQRLQETIADADRVLLLVSDHAISSVLGQYPFLHEKQLIHCSGAMSLPGVAGVHPLMSFADTLYELPVYRSIPFMCEAGYEFDSLLPGLPNAHFSIDAKDKAGYHAMCVMAGNFPQILWQAISARFEQQFELPVNVLRPYLMQLVMNFVEAPGTALTGPLVRNDRQTIERHLEALNGDPMQSLYRVFAELYQFNHRRAQKPKQTRLEQTI